MTVKNPCRMYRNGATQLVQVPLGRSGNVGMRSDESWVPVSGVFNDPGLATGVLTDTLHDTLHFPHLNTRAIRFVQSVWQANTGDTDAALTLKINAALNGAGYSNLSGGTVV